MASPIKHLAHCNFVNECTFIDENNKYHKQSQMQQTITLSRASAGGEERHRGENKTLFDKPMASQWICEYELLELNVPKFIHIQLQFQIASNQIWKNFPARLASFSKIYEKVFFGIEINFKNWKQLCNKKIMLYTYTALYLEDVFEISLEI